MSEQGKRRPLGGCGRYAEPFMGRVVWIMNGRRRRAKDNRQRCGGKDIGLCPVCARAKNERIAKLEEEAGHCIFAMECAMKASITPEYLETLRKLLAAHCGETGLSGEATVSPAAAGQPLMTRAKELAESDVADNISADDIAWAAERIAAETEKTAGEAMDIIVGAAAEFNHIDYARLIKLVLEVRFEPHEYERVDEKEG